MNNYYNQLFAGFIVVAKYNSIAILITPKDFSYLASVLKIQFNSHQDNSYFMKYQDTYSSNSICKLYKT